LRIVAVPIVRASPRLDIARELHLPQGDHHQVWGAESPLSFVLAVQTRSRTTTELVSFKMALRKGKMMPITVDLYFSKHPKRHVWTGLATRVRRRKRRTAKLQTKTELQLQLDLFTPDVPTINGTT
jgi:hypothetical protein